MSPFAGTPLQIIAHLLNRGTSVSHRQVYGEVGRVEKSSDKPEEIEAAVAKLDTAESPAVAAFLLLSTVRSQYGPIFTTLRVGWPPTPHVFFGP